MYAPNKLWASLTIIFKLEVVSNFYIGHKIFQMVAYNYSENFICYKLINSYP